MLPFNKSQKDANVFRVSEGKLGEGQAPRRLPTVSPLPNKMTSGLAHPPTSPRCSGLWLAAATVSLHFPRFMALGAPASMRVMLAEHLLSAIHHSRQKSLSSPLSRAQPGDHNMPDLTGSGKSSLSLCVAESGKQGLARQARSGVNVF